MPFAQFFVLYRAHRQTRFPELTSHFQMIQEVIGPGVTSLSHACRINAFAQTLYDILPLGLVIPAWPNCHLTVSKPSVVLADMSKHHFTNTLPLWTIWEPDVFDAKNCSELVMQIVGAFLNSSSGVKTNNGLFQLIIQFRGLCSWRIGKVLLSFLSRIIEFVYQHESVSVELRPYRKRLLSCGFLKRGAQT
jgi:hypothetical protein